MSAKPTEWTPSKLAVELRMDRRTIGRKLEGLAPIRKDNRGEYYSLRDVLDHLVDKDKKGPDLVKEQAKLAEARREKIELETEELRGELCRTSDVEQLWADMLTNCKTRLRSIPHNTAHRVMASAVLSDGLRILEDAVDEALTELAESGIPSKKAPGDSSKGADTATKADSKPVGRPRAKAKRRVSRGTG